MSPFRQIEWLAILQSGLIGSGVPLRPFYQSVGKTYSFFFLLLPARWSVSPGLLIHLGIGCPPTMVKVSTKGYFLGDHLNILIMTLFKNGGEGGENPILAFRQTTFYTPWRGPPMYVEIPLFEKSVHIHSIIYFVLISLFPSRALTLTDHLNMRLTTCIVVLWRYLYNVL